MLKPNHRYLKVQYIIFRMLNLFSTCVKQNTVASAVVVGVAVRSAGVAPPSRVT